MNQIMTLVEDLTITNLKRKLSVNKTKGNCKETPQMLTCQVLYDKIFGRVDTRPKMDAEFMYSKVIDWAEINNGYIYAVPFEKCNLGEAMHKAKKQGKKYLIVQLLK